MSSLAEQTLTAANQPAAPVAAARARRLLLRRSAVHGKGVFARLPLAAGVTVLEYVGEVISWPEALRRHPRDPNQPNHTFYFHIDEQHIIDAAVGGNWSRWINHSCVPNCQAEQRNSRIFICTLRPIAAGEELSYDYGLIIEQRYSAKLKAEYRCHCGAPGCRQTLLADKRRR